MENEKKIKEFETKIKLDDKAKKKELEALLSNRYGRAWFFDLLEYCGHSRTLATYDPYKMALCAGRHDVYLELIRQVDEIDPHILAIMKNEAKGKEVNNNDD